jgi:amino acid transporter
MVWSELGAAMPGSGGSYVYLREGFGRESFGRLMAFLFIWQFVISGPLEIASGYIGFAQYLDYIWKAPQFSAPIGGIKVYSVAIVIGLINIALLYRQITRIGKITVGLWIGALLTTGAVILTGVAHFDPKIAFDFPPGAFNFSTGFLFGLGAASRIGVYDYLGYYDICYIGDEVKNPGRTIPRSIIISVIAVAAIYVAINLSIIGTVPWREFTPAEGNQSAQFIVSLMMEKVYGSNVAAVVTAMILWTALGSCFALLLGYSRIPFAAARDGYFFNVFGRLHPKRNFPHVSLLTIGVVAIICSFFSLGVVIDVLIATRIIVQFVGQIFAVALLRKNAPKLERPYRIWLYPLPGLIALAGWSFIYLTLDRKVILFSLVALATGAVSFLAWSRSASKWPFTAPSPIPNR